MKKCIVLPYVEYQNEPSRPERKLVSLKGTKHRLTQDDKKVLTKLFEEVFGSDEGEESEVTIRKGSEDDYGDWVVEGDSGSYLFVTFVKEE